MKQIFEIGGCGYGWLVWGWCGGWSVRFGCHHHLPYHHPTCHHTPINAPIHLILLPLILLSMQSCSSTKAVSKEEKRHQEAHFAISDSVSTMELTDRTSQKVLNMVIEREYYPSEAITRDGNEEQEAIFGSPLPILGQQTAGSTNGNRSKQPVYPVIKERITITSEQKDTTHFKKATSLASQSTFDTSLDTYTTQEEKTRHSAKSNKAVRSVIIAMILLAFVGGWRLGKYK